MNIHVINLERSADRRDFMQAQLDGLNIRHTFFPAVDAKRGDLSGVNLYDSEWAIKSTGQTMSPGECGCFASHYRLWQHCVDTAKPIIVMEDDVIVEPTFAETMEDVARHIEDFRFIRLFGIWDCRHDQVMATRGPRSLVRYRKGPIGAQCYAVSPAGADCLLRHADRWVDPVDRYIDRFWHHGLHSYAIHPFPIRLPAQEPASTIAAERAETRDKNRQRWHRWSNRWARLHCNIRYRLRGDDWVKRRA